MPQKQKVAIEEKVRIVRECLGHKISISEATRIAGVDFETVKLWINKYENEGVEGFFHKGQKAYLGFSSTAHFSRVFKKFTGLTPREYREKHA